jgi:thiazole synthase
VLFLRRASLLRHGFFYYLVMKVQVNGQPKQVEKGITIGRLLSDLEIREDRVAVELNLCIVEKRDYSVTSLKEDDKIEIISFVGGGNTVEQDMLILGGVKVRSRLIVGTGKYKNFEETKKAIEISGAEMVTVAVRRVNILDRSKENLLDYINPKEFKILPNTAGCYTVKDAVRTAQLARSAGISDMVKLEVIGDEKTLFPDTAGLIEASKILVKEGFIVLPYTNDDPIVAKRLEEVGCAAVMPLAAPIGSGLGIRNPYNLRIIMETVKLPVIVDAGVGTASDAAVAMEMGCDGVLMNTGIAGAKDPLAMAEAMKYAVWAGRLAYKAGRIPKKLYATASSSGEGMIE